MTTGKLPHISRTACNTKMVCFSFFTIIPFIPVAVLTPKFHPLAGVLQNMMSNERY